VQGSVFFGGAQIWTDIRGLSACSVRGCTGQAYATIGWVQPRLSLSLELPSRFLVGAYVGDNLVHTDQLEVGLTFGVRLWSDPENRW